MKQYQTSPILILRDFGRFLKQPDDQEAVFPFSPALAFQLFVGLFVLRMGSIFLEVLVLRPSVLYLTGKELARQQVDSGVLSMVIGALVSAPIMEELAYRWGLRFSPARTALSLGLIVFYWLPYGGTYSTRILEVLDDPGFFLMVSLSTIAGLTAYALLRIPHLGAVAGQKWRQNFPLVYYLSSLLFGFMHIFNVAELNPLVLSLAPFITFQQIVFGFFNGYVRMRFGFGQAIAQHALFNALPVIIQLST